MSETQAAELVEARLNGKIEQIGAVMRAGVEQWKIDSQEFRKSLSDIARSISAIHETRVDWPAHRRHDGRINRVEQTYVNKEDFKRFEDHVNAQIRGLVAAQEKMKESLTRAMAWGGVIFTAINLGLTFWRISQ